MIYPQKLSSKNGEKILRVFLCLSVVIAIILVIINKLTTPNIHWAALANCGIIYTWITVMYSIKRSTNIAAHVLLQTIIISMVVLYIDKTIGFKGWSINIAIPIIIMVANTTMLILTIISHNKYIRYAVYQLIIVLISLITIALTDFKVLSKIAASLSIFSLAISLIFCYKDVKEAIIRKFHM